MKTYFALLISLGIGSLGLAQTPGNIGNTNLTAWFKADALTLGNVTNWTTTFPVGAAAITVTDATTPYPLATNIPAGAVSNYNTTIEFTSNTTTNLKALQNTGTLDLLDNVSSTDQGTFVAAYYLPSSTGPFNDHMMLYNEATGNDGIQFRNLGLSGRLAIGKGLSPNNSVNAVRNWTESHEPQIISYTGNRNGTGTMVAYNQSLLLSAPTGGSGSSGASGLYFGIMPGNTNSPFNGYLHEFIFYDTDLTLVELSKVHTYLAVKYGATLLSTGGGIQGDYVSTNGLTVWDASLTNAYHHDVIGLGRDDNQDLLQKQSHSFDDTTRIYLNTLQTTNVANTGTFNSDISYIILGSNDGSMCSTTTSNTEIPSGSLITNRLDREYKVTKTNFTDNVSFDFNTGSCGQFTDLNCLRLLVDDDGDFTNATEYSSGGGLSITVNSGIVTVSGVSSLHIPNNNTKYITIATILPQVDLGNDTTICTGAILLLNATNPNATYLWQNNTTDSVFSVTTPNTYWVEVSIGGCLASDSVNITPGTAPTVNLGNDTALCTGDSILLNALNFGASILWQDGSTSNTFNVQSAGLYWVQVTDSCGTVTDSINVTYNPYPTVNLGPDTTLCDGDTLLMDVTVLNGSYTWQNGDTNSIFNSTNSGTYWVNVTVNSCMSSDTIHTTFTPIPIVSLGPDASICTGDTMVITPNNPGSTFLWQDGSTNNSYSAFVAGTYWVEVTTNNCIAADSINVTLTPLPIVNLGNDTAVCTGDVFFIDASNVNGTYIWHDNTTASSHIVNQTGLYAVTVTVNTCENSDTINVLYNPIPVIDLGNDTTICFPDNLVLDASYPNASYLWQNLSSLPTYTVNSTGLFYVKVTALNCSFYDSINIIVYPKPNAYLGTDTLLCNGNSFTLYLSNTSTNTFLWQDNTTLSSMLVINPGLYWVQVTDGNCFNSDSILVTAGQVPVVDLGNDTVLCPGDSITLSVNSPNSHYLWNTGDTTSWISVGQTGNYWVDVTNECGTTRDAIQIDYTNVPVVEFGNDTILCMEDYFTLDASWPNSSYLWHDSSTLETYLVEKEGFYSVTITNTCGSTSDSISIEMEDCDCYLYIPNAFTPNGDGLDDIFTPVAHCATIKAYSIVIYDRWGVEVFVSEDFYFGWDGTIYGEPAPLGSYSYRIKYNLVSNGNKIHYKVRLGSLYLIR